MGRNTTLATMLFAWLAVLTGCSGGALGGGAAQTAGFSEAACAFGPPQTGPLRASPGESFRVHEEGFAADCYDTGQEGHPPPERDVPDLRQGEKEWKLAKVDAGPPPRYAIDTELTVPDGVESGRAVVEIHTGLSAQPVKVPLRVVGAESLPDTAQPDTGGRKYQ